MSDLGDMWDSMWSEAGDAGGGGTQGNGAGCLAIFLVVGMILTVLILVFDVPVLEWVAALFEKISKL